MKKIKNKLKKVLTKKIDLKNKLNIFVTAFAVVILASSIFAIGQKYQPGETLNPTCAPGEENCTVDIQITNNQSDSDKVIAFSVSRLDYRGYSAFLDFDNEFVDTEDAFSGHTFTTPVAGKYYLSWSFTKNAYSNSGTNNDVMLKVYKNGVYLNQAWSGEEAGNIDTASNSIIVDLAVNDEITFKAVSDGNRYMHMGGRAPGITASGFLLTGSAATAANESLPACGDNQIIVYSQSSNMWECKDSVDANSASVLKAYSIDFDCTLGGQFPDSETSFKFNMGHGAYKCLYMFHVGEVYSNSADKVYTCESKGLKDANGVKIPLVWKKDSTTWHKMWDKARSIASYGKFVFFGNAGDWSGNHFIGVDLLYHYSYPYKVYTDYGAYNVSSWEEPAHRNGQRSNYGQNGFVVCELGDMVAEEGSVVNVGADSGVVREYVDETSSKSFDNVYTNNTGSEIEVVVETNVTTTSSKYYGLIATIGGKEIEFGLLTGLNLPNKKISFIVPDGATYSVKKHSHNAQYVVLKKWLELKKN